MRVSFPRQVDKESRGPKGEKGLEFSRRKKGQTFFPSLRSLGLYKNYVSCLTTGSGKNLLANPVSPSISHEVMGPDAMILVF